MTSLHLVGLSPLDKPALARCLARAGEGDAVLLLGEAVDGAVRGGMAEELLRAAAGRVSLFVLAPDLEQRNIGPAALEPGIQSIDYPGFVVLTTTHAPIVSWF